MTSTCMQSSTISPTKQSYHQNLQGPISSVDLCRTFPSPSPLEYHNLHLYQQQHCYHKGQTLMEGIIPIQKVDSEMLIPPPFYTPGQSSVESSTMADSVLDHDILNNLRYIEDFDFTSDFDLFPLNDENFLSGGSFTEVPLFFPDSLTESSPDCLPSPPASSAQTTKKYQCPACPRSFPRACDLKRHALRHEKPFQCSQPACNKVFAEKRRRDQHVLAVHGLATPQDLHRCALCGYETVRPDALKRHIRLKHGSRSNGQANTADATPSTDSAG